MSTTSHTEARRLLSKGFKLCALHPLSKRPVGNGWQIRPITAISDAAGGYGMPLALNELCSIDPDNVEHARVGLKRCGFDLDAIMATGVRTNSTRPGSGGRSTFKTTPDLRRVVFASKTRGTVLELRAGKSNLQDCLPGTRYTSKDGKAVYEQRYATDRTMDQAGDLPPEFLAWWQRLNSDIDFKREQQRLLCGPDAMLAVSAGDGAGAKLAFQSPHRMAYNATHSVVDIIGAHGYTSDDGERWAPPTATGTPCVRLIPGKDDLWQSDHASDPLHGTFDAWSAHVVLDHDGDLHAAERSAEALREAEILDDFDDVSGEDDNDNQSRHPLALDWHAMPEHPPEPKFIIPGWMPDGVVTLFAAHGGTGKSFMSLYVGLCLATGRNPFKSDEPLDRVRVTLYSAEDGIPVMQARLARYMRLLEITTADLGDWFLVLDATESDNVLFAGGERGIGRTTNRFDWLQQQIADFGADVLIFDNASDGMDANENDRAKVRQFMSHLKRLAPAVLLLSHVDAMSSMADHGDAKGYSGSTGWHNSARSRWFMSRVKDSDDILLTVPKSNYARSGSEATIRWSNLAQVFEVVAVREGMSKAADHRSILLALLDRATSEGWNVSASSQTSASVYNTLKDMTGFPLGLKSKAVAAEVRLWLAEGLVHHEDYRRDNRSTGQRLALTDAGRALAMAGGFDDLL